ncbi:T9SS type A sorting domain-containing protein [Flavobacterium sp. 25HG05S-40]|uniref:T9SS type A sorting domain-containing protein n=1 Tax=Flavobacterium sp. 25HG05S-40 TaxID=3458682 RepID=UPI004044FA2B
MTSKLLKSGIILLLSFFNLNAQEIDSSFNNGSIVVPTISVLSSQNEKSRQVLIQDDNKIIIISHISNFTDSSYGTLRGSIIERYNSDGTLDVTYGTNGRIQIPHVSIKGKILSDGKLIIGSIVYRPQSNFQYYVGFVKLDNNGSYDASFGTNGVIATQTFVFDGFGDNFTEFEFSNSGNIYLLSWNSIVSGGQPNIQYNTSLYKFNSNCEIDTAFGNNGLFFLRSTAAQLYVNRPSDVLEDNSGNVFLSMGRNEKIIKLSSSGVLDASFGNSGIMNVSNGGVLKFIQVPGSKFLCSTENSLVRYNADFSLDNTFGNNGILNDNNKSFEQFQLDATNRILAIGKLNTTVRTLSRYTENGVLDTSSSDEGVTNISYTSLGYRYNFISDFKIQADNKIVLFGSYDLYNNGVNYQFQRFLTRLNPNLFFTLDDNEFETEVLDSKVYPNPFQDYFNIAITSSDAVSADLYDSNGRLLQNIFQDKLFTGTYDYEKVALSYNLSKGIYFVKLKNSLGVTKTIKICKD